MERGGAGRNRVSLFGTATGGTSSAPSRNVFSENEEGMLEQENERSLGLLSDKIATIKGTTVELHSEVRDHNIMLDGMDTQFDRSRGLLSGTMRKLNNMIGTDDSKGTLYVAIGVVVVVLILWWMMTRVTAGSTGDVGTTQDDLP